jgi:hypothetical protein
MHRLNLLSVIFPDLAHVPLHEMERRLLPLNKYPKEASKALFLHELFPKAVDEELLEFGKYLKISNKDLSQLIFYVKNLPYSPELSRFKSVQFYAHPDSDTSLADYAAHLDEPKEFLEKHQLRKEELKWHIDRMKSKNPVLTSKDLFDAGVPSGVSMGNLLKVGEMLSIENDLQDPSSVLEALKQSPDWISCKK